MARVLFRLAGDGRRMVRGALVRRLQEGLAAQGFDPGKIDGVYGSDSVAAVRAWQQSRGRRASGEIDFADWQAITGEPVPHVEARCLQVTADFEGHGFGKLAGNFDGAGVTWGVIGFTLLHGEVQAILGGLRQHHRPVLETCFGLLLPELEAMLDAGPGDQMAWADRISRGSRGHDVDPAWQDAFAALGATREAQAAQMARAGKYFAIARRDAARFNLKSELGRALCFDIAVQNGGIDSGDEEREIGRLCGANPELGEDEIRMIIAEVVAEQSRPEYVDDVRARKRTIASGEGEVHGARYSLSDWALEACEQAEQAA